MHIPYLAPVSPSATLMVMAHNKEYYEGKRQEILGRVQRDKDQFIVSVLELAGRLIESNQREAEAIAEIDIELKNHEVPTP